jgi:hypothetical protein
MNTQANQKVENKSQTVANSLGEVQSNREATFKLVDNRPEGIAQRRLKDVINNSPRVQQLKAYRKMANNSFDSSHMPIQRYVSVTSDNKDDDADYVTLNSIAFANQIAGGTIENFDSSDFSEIGENEKIAFVGHGGQGSSGNHTGVEIGNLLISEDKGMPDGNHDITFTSCNAGKRTGEANLDSVVDSVKSKIISKWDDSTSIVKGAVGPSVKTMTAEGQEKWGVVDPAKVGLAGQVQTALNKVYNLNIRSKPDLEGDLTTKANTVQEDQRPYFLDFVNIINGNLEAVSELAKAELISSGLMDMLTDGISAENPIREL